MSEVREDSILNGEPFKVSYQWFRCVIERPGFVRLTWGPTPDWADWKVGNYTIVPENEVAAAIVGVNSGRIEPSG